MIEYLLTSPNEKAAESELLRLSADCFFSSPLLTKGITVKNFRFEYFSPFGDLYNIICIFFLSLLTSNISTANIKQKNTVLHKSLERKRQKVMTLHFGSFNCESQVKNLTLETRRAAVRQCKSIS